jgi:predicted nucleic acid-binding protein
MTDTSLVIDASVLAQLYVRDEDEPFTAVADALVRQHSTGSIELVAPQFILYEIPSAIHRAVRRRRLDPRIARLAIRHFFNLGLRTLGSDRSLPLLIETAFLRASQLGCHVYDALYLVVAETLGYRFITADRRLYDQVREQVDYIVWIEDYRREADPSS